MKQPERSQEDLIGQSTQIIKADSHKGQVIIKPMGCSPMKVLMIYSKCCSDNEEVVREGEDAVLLQKVKILQRKQFFLLTKHIMVRPAYSVK